MKFMNHCLKLLLSIVQVVREALENTPPELSSDLVDKGIVLCWRR